MLMSNETYDFLKQICTTYFPAAITCFITIASIVNMNPTYVEMVAGICTALNTFLGVCLGISTENYYKGKH